MRALVHYDIGEDQAFVRATAVLWQANPLRFYPMSVVFHVNVVVRKVWLQVLANLGANRALGHVIFQERRIVYEELFDCVIERLSINLDVAL